MATDGIIQDFNKVLTRAAEAGASDVHLRTGSRWKLRLNGRIAPIRQLGELSEEACEQLVRHLVESSGSVPQPEVDEFTQALRDYDCSYALPGVARFRVNLCRQQGSHSIVLRTIPDRPPTIEELNLPPAIREIAHEERGLVLVTGTTGSGKSTTLAAMINEINRSKPCKIITIEDPIEFIHREDRACVIQREVGTDTESFADALRAALRQDPDIILVGEMRDRKTIDIAMKAAETGHLVLSTLHTLDAPKAIQRILNVFELSQQNAVRLRLAELLKAVISQRLLRREDQEGRVAVLEIMRHTLSVEDAIANPEKDVSLKDLIAAGRDQYGSQTFDQHLMELFQGGIISLESAKSAATSAADFERNVQFV